MKTIKWNALVVVVAMATMVGAPACVMEHGDDMGDDGSGDLGKPDPEPDPTPTGTSTLRVENKSSYTIFHVYLWRCTDQPNTLDQLGSKTVAPEGVFTLTNVPPGCWYVHARNSTSVYWQTPQGVTLQAGKQFTWQLFN
jgi:hypothetical protein